MEATGSALLILGAVCLVAAIVGGNVSLPGGATFGALESKSVRIVLGLFAAGFFLLGFILLLAGTPKQTGGDGSDAPEPGIAMSQVNEICDQNARAREQIDPPAPEASYAEWEGYIEQYVVSWDNTLTQLRAVPAEDSEIDAALDKLPDYVVALEALGRAYAQEDDGAASLAIAQRDEAVAEFNQLARQAGLAGCVIRQQ